MAATAVRLSGPALFGTHERRRPCWEQSVVLLLPVLHTHLNSILEEPSSPCVPVTPSKEACGRSLASHRGSVHSSRSPGKTGRNHVPALTGRHNAHTSPHSDERTRPRPRRGSHTRCAPKYSHTQFSHCIDGEAGIWYTIKVGPRGQSRAEAIAR
jgi:hypothetical protein